MRILLSVLAIASLLSTQAMAQSRGLEPGAEAESWAGVGILQIAGGGWCSAALIAPDTVLTAAHCVYPAGQTEIAAPERVTFHAGWRDGLTAARRNAVRIVAHRDYDPSQPYAAPNIAADLALVYLDLPVDPGAARPFGQMDRVRVGEPVSIVSFSGLRSDVASITEGCDVQSRDGDILILDCPSYSGMSGAPVFGTVNGKPEVIALISGSRYDASGSNRAIALAIRAPLGRVSIDADSLRSTPLAALPSWSARVAARATPLSTAARKTITVSSGTGFGLGGGTGSGRKVVRPPSGN